MDDGGELDLDMNVREPKSTEAVENVYWKQENIPPHGKYKVVVNNCAGKRR